MAALISKVKKNFKNLGAFANPRRIGYIIFYVTNRCNFRCKFCFYYAEIEKGRKPNELSVEEIEQIAKSTGALLQLSLTGGEPFVRKEFAEITSIFVENTGVRFITIPTNASLTDRMVRYLETVLPQYPDTFIRLTFSVDGIGEDHDENRSMPGSFDKIIESYKAISPLRKHFRNLVLDTNSVFTKKTEDSIVDILRYLNENFEF
ncbi:MAG: radical SAM protein, partial [Bacteroidota bacterium]